MVLTGTMLEAAGFDVTDLGIDVSPRRFVTAVQDKRADVVAIFARPATTVPTVRGVIERIKDASYRDRVKVLIVGASRPSASPIESAPMPTAPTPQRPFVWSKSGWENDL